MANKNHKLDKPIIESAKIEFLKNGFQTASISNIAKKSRSYNRCDIYKV